MCKICATFVFIFCLIVTPSPGEQQIPYHLFTTNNYGTNSQIETNHTMALQWQTTLADIYSEILPNIMKDSEINREELSRKDLFVLGDIADNRLLAGVAKKPGIDLGRNYFSWQGRTYGDEDDGLIVVFPNPYNIKMDITPRGDITSRLADKGM